MNYKKLLILKLSNITEWKSEAEMIIPNDIMSEARGHLFTCEFLDSREYTLRGYYASGKEFWMQKYKDGQPHGLSLGWHESGNKSWEQNWQNGKIHGRSIGWHEDGRKCYEDWWRNGKWLCSELGLKS